MQNVIIYVRVSTDDQKENGHSIENQINVLKNAVERNHEFYNLIIINDEGRSSTNPRREGYLKLKEMINNNEVDYLYITSLDRLNRELIEAITFLRNAAEQNIVISLPNEVIDLSLPERELAVYIRVLFAYFELKIIGFRTKGGIAGGLKKGIYTKGGKKPLGYMRDEDKKLIFDPNTCGLVFDIINDYAYSSLSINQLEAKYEIDYSTINKILIDPIYRGYTYYNDERHYVAKEFYIDEKLNQRIQAKLEVFKKKESHIYLFKGKLFCNDCHHELRPKITKKASGNYLYYCCTNKNCDCYKKQINEQFVLQILKSDINEVIVSYDKSKANLKVENTILQRLDIVSRESNKLRVSRKRLLNAYLDYKVDKKTYEEKRKELDIQIEKNKEILNELLGGYNYNRVEKRELFKEYLPNYYIDIINKSGREIRLLDSIS